ncbi:hypothetical protein OY671_007144 [Metschnikowia pulcherrima]|nr:hypothetical protein OY671_007144 [Metschnikowia pulcherrima]
MYKLGIRQTGDKPVTGTTIMMEEPHTNTKSESAGSNLNTPNLHMLKKNNSGIILHPQPEDNPNDPLNWPMLRKDLCFLIIGFQTFIGGGQTPILAAGFRQLSGEFDKTVAKISYLVGAFMLALGLGSVFASPTAILYGKRLVYLLGIVIFLIGAVVCACSANYGGLMAGRILTGFGASPTESLASASLSDLYFQHERAYRTGLYTLLLLGGKNILPLLSSLIFQHLDRHWLYWIQAMFLGVNLLLTFLFVPETYWDRTSVKIGPESVAAGHQIHENSRDTASVDTGDDSRARHLLTVPGGRKSDDCASSGRSSSPHTTSSGTSMPKSFTKRLHLISGRHSADKWWMVALRPLFLYCYPPVLYGAIVYSLAVVWLIVISEVLAEIFQAEGYGYSAQTVGLFYLSPFVGGILGSLAAGILGDRVTSYIVKVNHGVYEPEFRLFMLIPSTIVTCIGLMGYGWSSHVQDPWIAPVLFFGCLSFGSSMASTTAITYTVDCYKMFAAEALVSFNLAKNVIGFVFSLFNNDAFLSLDGKRLFVIYGCAQLFVSLLGIVMYVYGKVSRAWTDDRNLLRCLYHADRLETEKKTEAAR